MNRKTFLYTIYLFLSVLPTVSLFSQTNPEADIDARFIRQIHDVALTEGRCYPWLHHLTKKIGARLAGSPQAAAAVEYTFQMLDTLGLDSVWLQPCTVPHWVRGEREIVRIAQSDMGTVELRALALGNSVGTDKGGISAEVVRVLGLDELEKLGEAKLKGKIVFFDRPFDATKINTFEAYGGAVDQRGYGASEAARFGAIGVLVRSMASGLNDVPHTGGLIYKDGLPKIPACAISTNDAELLGSLLKKSPVKIFMRTDCKQLAERPSFNVIGEIRGSEHPAQIIVVGGHLDSWDVGEGAHDDGAGCVQSMDVLQVFKRLNYKPKRTIRCVLFMNEENGLRGGTAYGDEAMRKGELHMAAIESDRGGFTPRGFTVDGETDVFAEKFPLMQPWLTVLEPFGLRIKKGGGGADISPLKKQGVLLIGFEPDSQRYFDYHHTTADVFEAVNKRELELGTAAITSLIFLIDKYGL
ncbi:MAG: M28 family peptidase [Saprospiraceae bacterium]|nr:M28 family peptidase [Saprospiraceae bacterium]MCF8250262.1 M28 family peptidase [Saprospiraceae bacterium]MCF8280910.1 M28 family peptidase [Bacteroidales bacterium]MCF8312106.1 M28 family peptidase [Saprospiraceae bacterium]MCF8440513.1 M28 family peptidase [Saprospiraceae bacterium]